jgi:hypothetical protein
MGADPLDQGIKFHGFRGPGINDGSDEGIQPVYGDWGQGAGLDQNGDTKSQRKQHQFIHGRLLFKRGMGLRKKAYQIIGFFKIENQAFSRVIKKDFNSNECGRKCTEGVQPCVNTFSQRLNKALSTYSSRSS